MDLPGTAGHAGQHADANDAIEALEAVTVGPVWFNVKGYGAVGDGVTDDTAAINAAIADAGDGTVYFPAGTYQVSSEIQLTSSVTLAGAGIDATDIRASAAMASVVRVGSTLANIRDLEVDANNLATHGLDIWNAGRGTIENVRVRVAVSHGVYIDENISAPKGNNNLLRFVGVVSTTNGGSGFYTLNRGTDHNGLEFFSCEAAANSGAGMVMKGISHRVIGGIYRNNGTYGISIAEAGDVATTQSCLVLWPWLEGNVSGGVFAAAQSVACHIILDSAQQTMTSAATSENLFTELANSSGPIYRLRNPESDRAFQFTLPRVASATPPIFEPLSTSTSNASLTIRAQGGGRLTLGTTANLMGFFGSSGSTRPAVTGTFSSVDTALQSLLGKLQTLGIIAHSATT